MEIIAELEATGREVYTGAIGYVEPGRGTGAQRGDPDVRVREGKVWFGAGGGS